MTKETNEIIIKNPKKLKVYEKCMNLNKEIYQLVKQFPKEEKYRLESQIIRSCTSIGANLVEGNGQIYSAKELNFLNNSLGSANETLYWVDLASRQSYITEEQENKINVLLEEIIRIIISLMKKIRTQKTV